MIAPAPSQAQEASRPREVLIVDDNRDAADTLATLLRARGHRVEVAYDGATALEAAARARPDLAFLDIGLPDIDGLEVARQLRQRFAHPPPMIALTGYGQASDREASLAAGFNAHLTKPLGAGELEAVLSSLFGPDPALQA
jgi:CheY-like chemotaxis protein